MQLPPHIMLRLCPAACRPAGVTKALALAFGTAVLCAPVTASAETTGSAETVPGDRSGATQPIANLVLSSRMYAEGRAAGDATMVIAAAAIRRDADLRPAEGTDPMADPQINGWREMLDTARDMAAGDPVLTGLIEDAAALRVRGVSTGALFRNATLDPGGSTEYEALSFDGDSAAEVYVEGVQAADLNLFVYDENKTLVCADEDTSFIAHCYWEPEREGTYVIKVVNRGAIPSSYALITN